MLGKKVIAVRSYKHQGVGAILILDEKRSTLVSEGHWDILIKENIASALDRIDFIGDGGVSSVKSKAFAALYLTNPASPSSFTFSVLNVERPLGVNGEVFISINKKKINPMFDHADQCKSQELVCQSYWECEDKIKVMQDKADTIKPILVSLDKQVFNTPLNVTCAVDEESIVDMSSYQLHPVFDIEESITFTSQPPQLEFTIKGRESMKTGKKASKRIVYNITNGAMSVKK